MAGMLQSTVRAVCMAATLLHTQPYSITARNVVTQQRSSTRFALPVGCKCPYMPLGKQTPALENSFWAKPMLANIPRIQTHRWAA